MYCTSLNSSTSCELSYWVLTETHWYKNQLIIPLDGVIPPDGRPINVTSRFKSYTVAAVYTLTSLGVILAVVCLAFNIVFRNRKWVHQFLCVYVCTCTYGGPKSCIMRLCLSMYCKLFLKDCASQRLQLWVLRCMHKLFLCNFSDDADAMIFTHGRNLWSTI